MNYLQQVLALSTGDKFSRWYAALVERAHDREIDGYTERHHILPRCFGLSGNKDPLNIVQLTAREHFVAHELLARMFSPSSNHAIKMRHALRMISQTKNRYHIGRMTSRSHIRLGAPGHTSASRAKMQISALDRVFNDFTLLGHQFNSFSAAQRHFNLSPTQLQYLLADPTQQRLASLHAKPLIEGFDTSIPTMHDGVTYPSIRKAAIATGVSYTKFRLMKGL